MKPPVTPNCVFDTRLQGARDDETDERQEGHYRHLRARRHGVRLVAFSHHPSRELAIELVAVERIAVARRLSRDLANLTR